MPPLNLKNSGLALFAAMTILYFFSIFHRVATAAVAPNLIAEFNTDNSLLGLMSGMYFYAYAAAQIPVGLMLDKIGIQKTLTTLGLIAALGNLIFALSPNIPMLATGRFLIGFGVGGFYVSALKALATSYNPKKYATLTGTLTSIGHLGGLIASSPLALLSIAIGWRESFLIIFTLIFIFVAITHFTAKNQIPTPTINKNKISQNIKTVFTNKELLKISFAPFFVYGCFISFQGLWASPFLITVYNMTNATASIFYMFIGIGFIVAFPITGAISDKIKKRKPILLTGITLTMTAWTIMTIFGAALQSTQLIALLFFLGVAFGTTSIYLTIPVKLFPLQISGIAIAGLNIFNFIGGGVFQYLFGYIIDNTQQAGNAFYSYQIIFAISAIGALVSLAVTTLFKEHQQTKQS